MSEDIKFKCQSCGKEFIPVNAETRIPLAISCSCECGKLFNAYFCAHCLLVAVVSSVAYRVDAIEKEDK